MRNYKGERAKEEREYTCGYCKNKFKQQVGRKHGQNSAGVSSQVKCPRCGNFLKTWDDEE